MSPSRLWNNPAVWIGGTVLLAGLASFFIAASLSPKSPAVSNTQTNNARATYAALYQALWRQDDGQDNLLMTATLFLPETFQALGQDTQRSEVETQLLRSAADLEFNQAAIVLTFDSVSQTVPDAQIQSGLQLQLDDQTSTSTDWKPAIGPSHVVNAAAGTSSQIGLAIFTFDQTITWPEVERAILTAKNIGGQAERRFEWLRPSLTTQVEN